MAFSPPVVGCLLKKAYKRGGHRHPRTPPGYALATWSNPYLILFCLTLSVDSVRRLCDITAENKNGAATSTAGGTRTNTRNPKLPCKVRQRTNKVTQMLKKCYAYPNSVKQFASSFISVITTSFILVWTFMNYKYQKCHSNTSLLACLHSLFFNSSLCTVMINKYK